MSGLVLLAATAPATAGFRVDPTALLMWITCLVTLGGAIITAIKYGRPILAMARDFNGEAERPGVPHRLGVMERLQALDIEVSMVKAEITPNGGGSIKDAVMRMDSRMIRLETDVKGIHERMDQVN